MLLRGLLNGKISRVLLIGTYTDGGTKMVFERKKHIFQTENNKKITERERERERDGEIIVINEH